MNAISSQTRGQGQGRGHGRGCGMNLRYHGSYCNNSSILFYFFYKKNSHGTTISGVILRQNKKMRSVYKINLLRTMRIIVIHMI